jgi:hypothetical protein
MSESLHERVTPRIRATLKGHPPDERYGLDLCEYQVYRVADKDAGPKLDTTQGRAKGGGPLVDSDTVGAVRAASTMRATRHNNRPQTGKDFGR